VSSSFCFLYDLTFSISPCVPFSFHGRSYLFFINKYYKEKQSMYIRGVHKLQSLSTKRTSIKHFNHDCSYIMIFCSNSSDLWWGVVLMINVSSYFGWILQ
jgi:hypothetical protein